MKGIILAGGLGTRLFPLTRVTNKHLLPVWNRPMIHYPIQCLVNAGITDILLVTGGNNSGDFLRLLGNGKEFGLKHLELHLPEGGGGDRRGPGPGRHWAEGSKICVILGDNIIEGNIRDAVESFESTPQGARILLKEVSDPQRFGVAEIEDGRVVGIVEKPAHPKSNLAVAYFSSAESAFAYGSAVHQVKSGS